MRYVTNLQNLWVLGTGFVSAHGCIICLGLLLFDRCIEAFIGFKCSCVVGVLAVLCVWMLWLCVLAVGTLVFIIVL